MMQKKGLRIEQPRKVKPWAVAFWLLLWQAAAMLAGQDFLLASPLQTLRRFFELAMTADFYLAALLSLSRIMAGFLLGLALGGLLAWLSARFGWLGQLLAPLCAVLRAIPVASFVVAALIWLPSRRLASLVSLLVSFPLIYTAALEEIRRADPKLIEMARLLRMPPARQLAYIYLLPGLRGFKASCATAIGFAWKSGVAAELISIPAGTIGERLYEAKIYLMSGDLFAWTILIVLLSALCARLLGWLMQLAAGLLERG